MLGLFRKIRNNKLRITETEVFTVSVNPQGIRTMLIRNVKKVTKGTDLEVHHIVEKRFSEQLGFGKTGSSMPSVALSKTEHRGYTNEWRKYAGYGKSHTPKDILKAAITTYSNNPQLMGAAIYTITRELK